ncbi:colicin E3/pyocin S6 family cytotoxin [Amycolatopsis sp. NPDC059021]|uniref:colicin E3/pyocin S6 family cytotoxin n=1 Tax=Amycolatopsis sp. NPDC059021 TaxID=3346704 RepID=UPI00366F8146
MGAPPPPAAAAAAESASAASRSAADAQRSAAAAAEDAAAARNAGARASQADDQAQGDAQAARRAANAAASDAAIAGRSAASAESDAATARGAASNAERDAAIARDWADKAEAAASWAEDHAKNAAAAAAEAVAAAQRAEQAEKQPDPGTTPPPGAADDLGEPALGHDLPADRLEALRGIGYTGSSRFTWQEALDFAARGPWPQAEVCFALGGTIDQCRPGGPLGGFAGFIYDVFLSDIKACAIGNGTSCAMAVAGAGGRAAKILGEAAKIGEDAAKAGAAARKIPGYIPPPKGPPPGVKGATIADRKTSVQGGGGLRKRWKDDKGNIYEWDSRHGEWEMYNKRGKHQGVLDSNTGEQIKGPDPSRSVEP